MSEYTKLDEPTKESWCQALRSGRYKQGKHLLQTPNGYCCLGVLANEAGMLIDERCEGSLHSTRDTFQVDADASALLMAMNDQQDKSFDEIADWIEENL